MPSINEDIQLLDVGSGYIELYQLDCTNIGGTVYYFTNTRPVANESISFNGQEYMPLPIATSGFERKQDGSQDRPILQVSNINKVLLGAIVQLGDIVGAKLTRLRTLSKYLDSGATPNGAMTLPPDVYYVAKKTSQDATLVQFDLCTALERFYVKLPRRQVTRAGDSRYCSFPAAGRTRLR